MVDVNDSSLRADSRQKLDGLFWGRGSLGIKFKFINQMNQVNSHNGSVPSCQR